MKIINLETTYNGTDLVELSYGVKWNRKNKKLQKKVVYSMEHYYPYNIKKKIKEGGI